MAGQNLLKTSENGGFFGSKLINIYEKPNREQKLHKKINKPLDF